MQYHNTKSALNDTIEIFDFKDEYDSETDTTKISFKNKSTRS